MSELIATVLRASQHRFIGRLARDPEMRFFESGKCVCNCRMLIPRPGSKRDDGQEPDGFKLEMWNERAQAFADAHRKGDLCDVTGRVKSESWTAADGTPRTGLVVMVDSWSPVGGQSQAAPVLPVQAAAPAAAPVWESSADEVPF